jgi:hypothetical protein
MLPTMHLGVTAADMQKHITTMIKNKQNEMHLFSETEIIDYKHIYISLTLPTREV